MIVAGFVVAREDEFRSFLSLTKQILVDSDLFLRHELSCPFSLNRARCESLISPGKGF